MSILSWLGLATIVFGIGCGDSSSDPPLDGSRGGGASLGKAGGNDGGGTFGGSTNYGGSTEGGTGPIGGDAAGGAPPDNAPVHLVILGASTSCGKNLDQPQYGGQAGGLAFSWPNRYGAFLAETRPGSSIDNLCKAGYNTYHAMPTGTQNPPGMPAVDPAKNITAAIALAPDAIIVSFPAADASSNVAEIMSNLHVIEATAAAASIPVWVSTPQPNEQMTPGDLANKLALRSNVIGDFGTHALDFWAPLVGPNDSWDPTKGLTDGVHPNALGHQLLFDVVVSSDIPGALGL